MTTDGADRVAREQQISRESARSRRAYASATSDRRTLLHEVARLNRKCAELQAELNRIREREELADLCATEEYLNQEGCEMNTNWIMRLIERYKTWRFCREMKKNRPDPFIVCYVARDCPHVDGLICNPKTCEDPSYYMSDEYKQTKKGADHDHRN